MKISLLGQFGSGNSGNDGSLEAMLLYLRKFRPDAELVCICSNPGLISERYALETIGIGGPALSSHWARTLNRIFFKLPRRIMLLVSSNLRLAGFDLMIVPGTGILDDFQEKAFGWPFVVFCWCILARLCRMEIAFVSIGAGPIKGRLSRFFLRSAARMAVYRSYRDNFSLEFMRGIGIDVSRDRRFPDIAFTLPCPADEIRPANKPAVAVGLMNYRGWRASDPQSDAIYADYIIKISGFIGWLLEKGVRVSLLTGDETDRQVLDEVTRRLARQIGADGSASLDIAAGASLHDIMTALAGVDLAIVSRYHNLICALKLQRPTISIGYARKNDDLMGECHQDRYCFHIETFNVEDLKAVVVELLDARMAAAQQIRRSGDHWQKQLAEQELLLNTRFLSRP